jgi:hypothetical protein
LHIENTLTKIFWFTLFRLCFSFSLSGVCGHMRHGVYGTCNDNFGFVYEAKMVEIEASLVPTPQRAPTRNITELSTKSRHRLM